MIDKDLAATLQLLFRGRSTEEIGAAVAYALVVDRDAAALLTIANAMAKVYREEHAPSIGRDLGRRLLDTRDLKMGE